MNIVPIHPDDVGAAADRRKASTRRTLARRARSRRTLAAAASEGRFNSRRNADRRSGLRVRTRRLVVMAALAVPLVGGPIAALPASPAAAAQYGRNPDVAHHQYFQFTSTTTCISSSNSVLVSTFVTPRQGYAGMWVSVRNYLELTQYGTTVGNWGSWTNPTQLGAYGALAQYGYLQVPEDTTVRMYTEVKYWTGSGWSAPVGMWTTPYQMGYDGIPYYNGICQTRW